MGVVQWLGVLLLLVVGSGCTLVNKRSTPVPVEGTTARIGPSTPAGGAEVNVEIFTSRRRCKQVFSRKDNFQAPFTSHEQRINACIPKVDRRTGEVQLSFRVSDPENIEKRYLLPLTRESIQVAHMGAEPEIVELVPHEPTSLGQLFILVIDHSASMLQKDGGDTTRMERVLSALWQARDAFFVGGSQVAMLRFTDTVEGLDGTPYHAVKPVSNAQAFREQLAYLGNKTGYTHLYKATQQVMGPVLGTETAIADVVREKSLVPTVVVLTDGFNNLKPSDTCGDNAARLQKALKGIKTATRKALSERPILYTVGFGHAFRPGYRPEPDSMTVSPRALCGQFAQYRIDGGLEKSHIDNVSLAWMAQIGGGKAFIRSTGSALADAFRSTSPTRYHWYQVKYRKHPFYLRNQFTSLIQVIEHARGESHVDIYPSGWIDAPPGKVVDGWTEPSTVRWAAVILAPALGVLIFLMYLGPASFNARRAITRRSRKTSGNS